MNTWRSLWRRGLRWLGLSPGQRMSRASRRQLQGLTRAQCCEVLGVSVFVDDAELERARLEWRRGQDVLAALFDHTGVATVQDLMPHVDRLKRGAERARQLEAEMKEARGQ